MSLFSFKKKISVRVLIFQEPMEAVVLTAMCNLQLNIDMRRKKKKVHADFSGHGGLRGYVSGIAPSDTLRN